MTIDEFLKGPFELAVAAALPHRPPVGLIDPVGRCERKSGWELPKAAGPRQRGADAAR